MALSRRYLLAAPELVAPRLLGARLESLVEGNAVSVRITEVEAYAGEGEDPGSHAYRGRTSRNAAMFGEAGHAYVYFTYGLHWCLNVVTGAEGVAGAVLIRAGEVVGGLETATHRRNGGKARDLARGPARLAQALGVTGELNATDLIGGGTLQLVLGRRTLPYERGPRTGVAGAGAQTPWRFWVPGDQYVSSYRSAKKSGR